MPAIDLRVPPIAPSLPKVHIPRFEQHTLSNGLNVVLLRDSRFPSVSLRLGIAGGNRVDPAAKTGVAETLASMLTNGTSSRTAREIADAAALIGANLHFSASDDFFVAAGSVLEDELPAFLSLFSECLLDSSYPEEELALHKQNRMQELLVERSEAGYWADAFLFQDIFGDHPYAVTSPEPGHIASLERTDLQQMWKKRIGPGNAVLVLVGDLPESARIVDALQTQLSSWNTPTEDPSTGKLPAGHKPMVLLVNRPGSVQAEVRLGRPGICRTHEDYFPLSVLNALLGGGASSRLFTEIREKQGLAYHVSSSMMALQEHGILSLSTQVAMDRVGDAIRGLHHEMRRLSTEAIPAAELHSIRNYLNGTFVLRLESHGSLANQFSAMRMLGLGDDYLERYVDRIAAVPASALQEQALKYFQPQDYSIVVVGDATAIEPQLKDLGPVQVAEVPST
jgi:zinc protease